MPRAWLVDIDGVLAKCGDRDIFDFARMDVDEPIQDTIYLVQLLAKHDQILLLTGRSEEFRPLTIEWLSKHQVPYSELFMRPSGDNRKDTIIKEEIYNYQIMHNYNVKGVFEDRLRCCILWHGLGLQVYKCGDPEASY